MEDKKYISIERLKKLEPISNLSQERLEELVTLSYVERMPIGMSLFREGEIDNQTIYLLEGDVQLTSADGKIDKVISANKDEAKFPIDDSQPRQVSGIALGRIDVLRIDNSILDYMMMWDQLAVSEETSAEEAEQQVAEKSEEKIPPPVKDQNEKEWVREPELTSSPDDDKSWIRKMRHIMAFKSMPAANIKALLEKMETILVNKGDVIVKQGEKGEYYYVLTEGEAQVTRTIELAHLYAGSSFGEEALVADIERNATVTMTSDGMVMRLSKENFNQLLKDPMLARVSPDDARARINKGGTWLDVRHAKEYNHSRLPKAINIPLHEIRMRMSELDKDKQYICYCSTGKRSSAAAFLLAQNGYKVSVLNGGIQVMAQDLVK